MLGYSFLNINDWILLTLVPANLFGRGTEVYLHRYGWIVLSAVLIMLLIIGFIIWFYRRSLECIRNVALTDPLTGGLNLVAFQIRGTSELKTHPFSDYALLYLDIRDFKRINKRYGVAYGNTLLHSVYGVLQSCLKQDELLARSAGDHFFLMLTCSEKQEVCQRLKIMYDIIEEQLGAKFNLSRASFIAGAHLVRDRNLDFLVLTDRAKMASKYQKRHQCCQFYDEKLEKKIDQERILEDSFLRAIQNHEFKLYIQPKVCPGQKKDCQWRSTGTLAVSGLRHYLSK
ncbi:signaling protein [gut metagenome]|uniref:Signaling protein n=1 Tax=gut metagenome TaxID=749906 RepID=J9GHF6_9ZZZZ